MLLASYWREKKERIGRGIAGPSQTGRGKARSYEVSSRYVYRKQLSPCNESKLRFAKNGCRGLVSVPDNGHLFVTEAGLFTVRILGRQNEPVNFIDEDLHSP
jgi:hypothetical protein